MSKIILILLILLSSISPSYADFKDIFPEDQYVYQYPEDKNKKIEVNTVRSPLEYTDNEIDQIKKSIENFKSALPAGAEELFTEVGFNKFSLGTGLINVTYQVRNGVKYALKDTLSGFPEYERRKATEEILNSNIRSHRITNKFLTGSSINNTNPNDNFASILSSNIFDWIFHADDQIEKSPNILVTAHKISKKELIKKLH